MKRIIEDLKKEEFTRMDVVNWGLVYPAIGLAFFVLVSVMIGRI